MTGAPLPDEFELIRRFFAPLAGPGGLGLKDDAAVLDLPAGHSLVATTDALVAGVHFLADDPPDLVARKMLRVNLSDLAAMGASPLGYLMVTAFPDDIGVEWLERFVVGLATDQAEYGVSLLGGDTTSTPGPLTLAVTALGAVEQGCALLRSGAKEGDLVYVSGTLGDGAFGLKVLRGAGGSLSASEREQLIDRYRLPRPRLGLGRRLVRLAHAAIDVSDGLIADLGHVAETSGLAALVEAERLPLSPPARALIGAGEASLVEAATGGDDYELLFTVPASTAKTIERLADELALPLTRIGRMEAGQGVRLLDARSVTISVGAGGYRHFCTPPIPD